MCYYRSSCLDLPLVLVDCKVEGLPLRLYHVWKEEYVLLNDIYFEGMEWNIFRDCVDKIGSGGKSDKFKKVGYRTVSGMI